MKKFIKSILCGFVLWFLLLITILAIALSGNIVLVFKIIGVIGYIFAGIVALWAIGLLIHSGVFLYKYNKRKHGDV